MYTQDGDYIKDIEINDLRNKYLLTKGATQKMVNKIRFNGSLIRPGDFLGVTLEICIREQATLMLSSIASYDFLLLSP